MKGKSFTTKEEINDESVAFMFFIIQQIYSIKKNYFKPSIDFQSLNQSKYLFFIIL